MSSFRFFQDQTSKQLASVGDLILETSFFSLNVLCLHNVFHGGVLCPWNGFIVNYSLKVSCKCVGFMHFPNLRKLTKWCERDTLARLRCSFQQSQLSPATSPLEHCTSQQHCILPAGQQPHCAALLLCYLASPPRLVISTLRLIMEYWS